MGYITNADIEQRLGTATYVQLADDDGDGNADTAVVDEARLAAESQVNSLLAVRFAVPLDLTVHPELADVLRSAALDLAEYRLRCRRPPVAEAAARQRELAMAWLEKVAAGIAELPAATLPANGVRGLRSAVTGETRVLSREELAEF
ncbi:MAG: DUF1320 family protein [Planctomycetes bacterium]|nr:DUF1320 family protein [Planctomycetota bacterium]